MTAPQRPPDWTSITPATIKQTVEKSIQASRELQDRVAALSKEKATFDNVILALAHDEAAMDRETGFLTFMQHVSPDSALRDQALASDKELRDFGIESSMRLDVFQAIEQASKHSSSKSLDHESQRLVDRMLRDGRRAGLSLPEAERNEVARLKKEIARLALEWSKINTEEKGFTEFTRDELAGVPDSVIDGFTRDERDGKTFYRVTNRTPDYLPVMDNARRRDTRKKLFLAYENRLADASSIFKQIIELRKELAKVLKAPTWADHVLEIRMAKDSKTALDFVDDLIKKLTPIGKAERSRLLQLQKELDEEDGIEHDASFPIWSYRFLDEMYQKRTLSLDNEAVKAYFPVDVVLERIFSIYQRLLGIRFKKLDEQAWHEDVQTYEVWDEEGSKGFLGHFLLDLYPREAKYSHAAVWGLIPGYEKPDGTRNYPLCAMVANLAKPTPNKPALMQHSQVVTFFHEAGHGFHQLLSKTRYARFHGTRVARDFVEAPSQMLENWCFSAPELKSMSSHYETGEQLPDDMIDSIIKSEVVNGGLFYLRQLFFGKFDLTLHTSPEDIDLEKLWCELREQISLVSFDRQYRPGYAAFGHLVGGYDAGYYGYLYSKSFSVDMFSSVFSADPMSKEAGRRYRKDILLPGGSRDEMDSLEAFLGRPPSSEPFMEKLLNSGPSSKATHL